MSASSAAFSNMNPDTCANLVSLHMVNRKQSFMVDKCHITERGGQHIVEHVDMANTCSACTKVVKGRYPNDCQSGNP
jgi:hypothetical protein